MLPPDTTPPSQLWKKIAVITIVGFLVALAYWQFRDSISLANLANQEIKLREYQRQHPVVVVGIAGLIYVGVTGLSLPGAVPLSLLYGWYFGWGPALLLVSFASTMGATVAFLLSRYLFRQAIENRFGARLANFNQALEREGPFFLFTLRLIPAVPFFVINAVMGLTPIRTRTFWWVSQLGMFPGTAVYIYAGSNAPNLSVLAEQGINAIFTPLQMLQILLAFALLGAFPFGARWIVKKYSPNGGKKRRHQH